MYRNPMGGMGRRGIGGLRGQFNRSRAMGRPAHPTPAPGQNFDLPSRPLGDEIDPMKQGYPLGMPQPGYTPPAAGMNWPPQNIGQPALDPRQQQEMKRFQQAYNDARASMPPGQQFDPRMIQRTDMPSGLTELPGYATPMSPPPSPQQFSAGPQVSLLAPQGPAPYQNISRPLGQPQPLGGPGQQMIGGPQQQGGGQAQGGAKWTMEIKPSEGGMYSGGIVSLAEGGVVPGYFLGKLVKKLAKGAAKLAPMAVGFIPGVSGLAAPLQGLIGGAAKGVSDLAQADWDFDALDVDSILEQGLGATYMAKAQQDPEWAMRNRNKIAAIEQLSSGQAGGQATDATGAATRVMPGAGSPGASGARGGAGDPGTITEVEQSTAQRYGLFDQLTGKAGGGQVGNLYAMRRFGGGPIKGYQEGGEFDEPMYRPPPRRRVRPRRRPRRARPVAPPPPMDMDEMPVMPDVMPVAPPSPTMRPQPAPVEAPPENIEPVVPPTIVAPPPPPPPRPAPVAPPPPPDMDDGGMGGLEEVLPEATGERRRRRQASPDEGGGERREERRSGDSGRRREEAGELGGEWVETTGGAEDPGTDTLLEEGDRHRRDPEQERMAERFAVEDEFGDEDESGQIENIRAIAQGRPADDITSIDGTIVPPPPQASAAPPPLPPETFEPPPVMSAAPEHGGGLFGAPTEQSPIDMFGAGASPFAMPTESAQFEDPRMKAMLERMDASEAPLQSYVPEPEPVEEKEDTKAQGKAEGGVVESMQEMPEVMQMLQMALQAPDDPQSQEIISTLIEAFGEEDFQKLVVSLQAGPSEEMAPPMQSGGMIPGNGDAMADDIRLVADAGTADAQPIDISSGEFVVAGDVVSHLGSGNTNAGAEVLEQFQEDVRMQRTGTPEQAPPIDLEEVLPGTYGERYA